MKAGFRNLLLLKANVLSLEANVLSILRLSSLRLNFHSAIRLKLASISCQNPFFEKWSHPSNKPNDIQRLIEGVYSSLSSFCRNLNMWFDAF